MMSKYSIPFCILLALVVVACGSRDAKQEVSQLPALKQNFDTSNNPDGIQWRDWDDGMLELLGSPRFGIVYFDTADCPPCYWMEDSTWSNPEVIAAIEKDFVPIRVMSARNAVVHYQGQEFTESFLRHIFPIPGYPCTMFLEGSTNSAIGGRPSIIPAKDMLILFGYFTSGAYKSVKLDEYRDNLPKEKKPDTH